MSTEITEEEILNRKMWDRTIFGIKFIDPLNGMGFSVGQKHRGYIVSHIVREEIDGEVVFQIFGKNDDGVILMKAAVGMSVYLTFEA